MATDQAVILQQAQNQLTAVDAARLAIDKQAEQTRYDNAKAAFEQAEQTWQKAQRRYSWMQDLESRRFFLQEQIAVLSGTP